MPVIGKKETIQEEGQSKEAFIVTFTNGAREQLEQLQTFFEEDDLTEVIKLGISFLQKIKEHEEAKPKEESILVS